MDELANNRFIDAQSQAVTTYRLQCFGDVLAKRYNYQCSDGMSAVWRFLMERHHWLPDQLFSMSPLSLEFALLEEMGDWPLPPTPPPQPLNAAPKDY